MNIWLTNQAYVIISQSITSTTANWVKHICRSLSNVDILESFYSMLNFKNTFFYRCNVSFFFNQKLWEPCQLLFAPNTIDSLSFSQGFFHFRQLDHVTMHSWTSCFLFISNAWGATLLTWKKFKFKSLYILERFEMWHHIFDCMDPSAYREPNLWNN
jgi:hypothetical protein